MRGSAEVSGRGPKWSECPLTGAAVVVPGSRRTRAVTSLPSPQSGEKCNNADTELAAQVDAASGGEKRNTTQTSSALTAPADWKSGERRVS